MDRLRKKQAHIAVIGDVMLDHYIWGSCERISPEAPVQVVSVSKESTVLGGAGNVVSNLTSLGAKVSLLSVVGADENAKQMQNLLEEQNIQATLVEEKGRRTTKKSRIIASNQQVIRYDDESKTNISLGSQMKLLEALQKNLFHYDLIVLSDYAKGVLTPNLCKDIISMCKR